MLKELRGFSEIMAKHRAPASTTEIKDTVPALSEEEQQRKIVAMVDAALGIKGK